MPGLHQPRSERIARKLSAQPSVSFHSSYCSLLRTRPPGGTGRACERSCLDAHVLGWPRRAVARGCVETWARALAKLQGHALSPPVCSPQARQRCPREAWPWEENTKAAGAEAQWVHSAHPRTKLWPRAAVGDVSSDCCPSWNVSKMPGREQLERSRRASAVLLARAVPPSSVPPWDTGTHAAPGCIHQACWPYRASRPLYHHGPISKKGTSTAWLKHSNPSAGLLTPTGPHLGRG